MAAERLLHERLPDVLNTFAAIFAIGMLPLVAIRLDAAMAWLTALNILPALLFGGVMSMGRFTSVLFPVFITLGLRLRSDAAVLACLSAWSLLQAVVAAMFFSWRSIY